ncbi:TVP38/TMEM64 family protein [Thalassotalea piscium]|uniref:TVP38/TMEM64 family membrane protein n=1 Tax=Thalassotalea piscium TaxID=1230533 RepID=A0A7X0NJF7_9GAMM|nr:VTT domain-containing protein [Thalassotalea piscium]MBB6544549.1 putative membrane protein YdjX (TVP38/TMEM64 family) [Thalassotalea piscium]
MKNKSIIKLSIVIFAVLALGVLYFFTPFSDYLAIDNITQLVSDVPSNSLTAFAFLGVFLVGGALLIPIPLIALTVSLVFNIWVSVLICLVGFILASLSGYSIGRVIGADIFGEKMKKHTDTLKDKMDSKGTWAILALRLAPTPPFTATSILAGSLEINIFKFIIGSTIGIAPLGLSAVFFGKGALELMKEPSGLAVSSIAAAVILFTVYYLIKQKNTE